jgi:hypothetical protein
LLILVAEGRQSIDIFLTTLQVLRVVSLQEECFGALEA